jgi:hypothetical protein
MIWPPQPQSSQTIQIPRSTLGTVRIIMPVGSDECFHLSAKGAGRSGESQMICRSGEAMAIAIGVASGLDLSFNNTSSYRCAAKKGFRPTSRKKAPHRRYVVCLDFLTDSQVLSAVSQQSDESSPTAPGSDIDLVVQAALAEEASEGKEEANEEQPPTEETKISPSSAAIPLVAVPLVTIPTPIAPLTATPSVSNDLLPDAAPPPVI